MRIGKELEDMAEDKKKQLPPGISLRKDGRYQARYTFNGKRHTIYGKDLKEVQKKLRDAKYEMDHGIFAKPDRITVDAWYQVWVKEYRENIVRESTLISYKHYYRHIGEMIGKMKVQAVYPQHVQKILNKMRSEGYSAGYIGKVRALMNLIFKQALLNGIIIANPVERTAPPKKEYAENVHKRALTEQEQRRFLEYAEKEMPFYADIFFIGFSTGMRIGEITALEWGDIDFANMEIHINGTMVNIAGEKLRKGSPKTAKSRRTVPMLPEIGRRVKRHKVEQAKLRMKLGDKWSPEEGLKNLAFTSPFGKPLWRAQISKIIRTLIDRMNAEEEKAAGKWHREPDKMEYFCPHAMRHTFATRALERGIPPKVVQSYLGHSTIDVTMNIYTHVTAELEKEEIKKIANQF